MRSTLLCLFFATTISLAGIAGAGDESGSYDPRKAFAETDLNKDGRIDIGEFHTRIVEVFYSADTDKDVYLDSAELSRLPFRETIVTVDRDGDGKIRLEEFVRIRIHQFLEADGDDDMELSVDEVVDAYESKPAR
jgi:hypothetical protein